MNEEDISIGGKTKRKKRVNERCEARDERFCCRDILSPVAPIFRQPEASCHAKSSTTVKDRLEDLVFAPTMLCGTRKKEREQGWYFTLMTRVVLELSKDIEQ